MSEKTSIDATSKVNLGILATLVSLGVLGAYHTSQIVGNVDRLDHSLQDLRQALDRNTEQVILDGKSIAILETMFRAHEQRLQELEKAGKGR